MYFKMAPFFFFLEANYFFALQLSVIFCCYCHCCLLFFWLLRGGSLTCMVEYVGSDELVGSVAREMTYVGV